MRTMIGTCQKTVRGGGGEKLNRDGGKKRKQERRVIAVRPGMQKK